MPQTETVTEEKPASLPMRGIRHKFLPLPVMPHHAQWFEAGPVTFAVEIRTIGSVKGEPGERSVSIHVFNPERTRESVRFDCFASFPHYHYILNDAQHSIACAYDTDANGRMLDWSFGSIRGRLPSMLRRADEAALAKQVEKVGLDMAVIDGMRQAIDDYEPSEPTEETLAETGEWYARWKKIHPQFNTAAGEEPL